MFCEKVSGAYRNRPELNRMLDQLRECHVALNSRNRALFVFHPLPRFDRIFTGLDSWTVALKTRTKFLLKFVRL